MSQGNIVALILGVLGILGGGGFLTYMQSRREAPVRQRDADLAVAEKSQQMAMVIAVAAQEHSTRLAERVDKLEEDNRVQRRTINEQGVTLSKLREGLRAFSAAWDDLATRWDHHRTQEHPPQRPNVNID